MEIDTFNCMDNDVLESLTREDGKYLEVSKKIAQDVSSNTLTILDVINQLGSLLLSQEFAKRDMGVLVLSGVLQNLNTSSTSPEQSSVLASYFCEKLKDHHQVATSAFKGVLALINLPNLPSESILQLLSTIFNHITCQQQQQLDRYLIYEIYEAALKQHITAVRSMGIDFVYGIISSIDGERDPKNLIYLFDWLQTFLKSVNLGHLSEEMFDVLSCYFPVDFKAPTSSSNAITREALALGLCNCLTAIPDFGQFALPLALEKLDSALKIAKVDSLDILKLGCKNYETQTYYQSSIEIWSQIQKEIFATSDEQLRSQCLETLKEVIGKLSHGDQKNFEHTILDIADTLRGNLLPDSKLFHQSTLILLNIAKGSQMSALIVAKSVGPLLENTFKITAKPEHKATILHTFVEFVKTLIEAHAISNLTDLKEIAGCSSLCSQAILENASSLVIEGFNGFAALAQLLPDDVRLLFLQSLHQALVASLPSNLKLAVHESFRRMAQVFPKEVEYHVLHQEIICDIVAVDAYLQNLGKIVDVNEFEDYVIETFIKYSVQDVASSTVALRHLSKLLAKFNHVAGLILKKDFLSQLVNFLKELEDDQQLSKAFLSSINLVLQTIARDQDVDWQKTTYLLISQCDFGGQNMRVSSLTALLITSQLGVLEDYNQIDFLLDTFLRSEDDFVKEISLKALASLLNKLDNEQVLQEKLCIIRQKCNGDLKVWLISWVTKSLVVRNHSSAWQWTDLLLNCLLENGEAAKGFKIILDESSGVLSKANYCQIMSLYKQKFFIYCMNKINEVTPISDAHLNAVGYLIENSPKLAIIGHFQKIFRLILLCLEKANDPQVLDIILQRLTEFVISGESIIEDRLEDILVRVLHLTAFNHSMIVRLAAIRCLHQITIKYKVYQLLPFKARVLEQLGVCVDDRKRLVRREAMECRSLWYLLDAPA